MSKSSWKAGNVNAKRFLRAVLIGTLLSFLGLEAYRTGVGVARYGSFSAYYEAKENSAKLQTAVDVINAYHVDDPALKMEAATDKALESILEGLDPYSEYLGPDQLAGLREDVDQQFGGIGIRVEMKDDRLTVVAPIEDTPGERAGLLRGDQILAVDGRSIEGRPLSASLEKLRGSPGDPVDLSVYRARSDERFDVTVKRERISIANVKAARILEDGIGYLRILQFGGRTAAEVMKAVDGLLAQGMTSLVIDLRNNPGGLLDAAVDVASPFLEKGQLVVYTEGRQSDQNEHYYAKRKAGLYDFPLALLVNSGSASASEIVAGVFKDVKRAVLVGEKTFGKGSVQSIIELGEDAGLRLTTAKYYTPSGYVIHDRGIEPDLEVELSLEEDRKLSLQRYRLEYMSVAEFTAEFDFEPIADRQLEVALAALRKS